LRKYLKLLTPTDEFIIVTVAAFGVPLVINAYIVLVGWQTAPVITEAGLRSLLIDEPIVLLIIAIFLHARDWTLETIGLLPSLKETLLGVGLAFVIAFLSMALWFVVSLVGAPQTATEKIVAGPFNPLVVIAVSVLNPIFEETILCGYVVTALKRRASWKVAVVASVLLRSLCHVYQGYAMIYVVVFGVVLAVWYARKGRLWPLIVTHVAYDFFPLLAYQG